MRPITAQPGYTEADVTAAMNSGQFVYADCFTFIPKIGTKLRYTTAQQYVSLVPLDDVVRQIYLAGTVLIKGLRVKNNLGIEVDEQQVELDYSNSLDYQASLTWAQALLQGRLDGASVRRDRYIATNWGEPWLGGFPMFMGLVSSLDKVGRQTATINVKSNLVLLNRQAPAYLWEPNCKNTWGDTACGVIQSDWAVTGYTEAGTTRSTIAWSSATADYNQGKIHISNGDDVTRVRTIARTDATHLYLAYPLDFDPAVGLHFTAYPGCPRTTDPTYGCPKYHPTNWESKFKGFPFVPVTETGI